jgi:hypothetical protein
MGEKQGLGNFANKASHSFYALLKASYVCLATGPGLEKMRKQQRHNDFYYRYN